MGDKTVTEGKTLTFAVAADDPDGDSVTIAADGLPEGASFNLAVAAFTWTPTYYQAGEYTVTFRASDTGNPPLASEETITVTVASPSGPVFSDDFADGAAPGDWRRVSGTWLASGGVYTARSLELNNLARIVPLRTGRAIGAGVLQARVTLSSTSSSAGPNGMLVFGYVDATHYRWVRITGTQVQIGQTGSMGGVRGGTKRTVARSHAPGRSVLLTVRVYPDGWVRVHEGAAPTAVASYRFLSDGLPSIVRGGVGLAAARARTAFDNVKVWEDSALAP